MSAGTPSPAPSPQDLVDAARRCFLRDGFDAATMRGIASEAGTSTSRLYVEFESKQDIYVAVLSQGNQLLIDEYLVPAMSQDLLPWERVMALVEAYMRFYVEQRDLATLLASAKLEPDDPHAAIRGLVAAHQAQMERLLSLMRELTAGSDVDAAHVVRWAWGAVFGVASINMRLPHLAVDDDEFDKIVGLGMRFVRAGLREAGQLGPPRA